MPLAVVRQVAHEIVPVVVSRAIGAVAWTAMVPDASGMVRVLVVLAEMFASWNANFLLLSKSSWNKVELSVKVLLVKVCAWFRNANVSLALSAGMVATREAVGAILLIVVVLVVPRTSWLVVFANVSDAKIGLEVVAIACGRLNVTAPVAAETITWLVVPVREVTPVFARVMVPLPLVTEIPEPEVASVASE